MIESDPFHSKIERSTAQYYNIICIGLGIFEKKSFFLLIFQLRGMGHMYIWLEIAVRTHTQTINIMHRNNISSDRKLIAFPYRNLIITY